MLFLSATSGELQTLTLAADEQRTDVDAGVYDHGSSGGSGGMAGMAFWDDPEEGETSVSEADPSRPSSSPQADPTDGLLVIAADGDAGDPAGALWSGVYVGETDSVAWDDDPLLVG